MLFNVILVGPRDDLRPFLSPSLQQRQTYTSPQRQSHNHAQSTAPTVRLFKLRRLGRRKLQLLEGNDDSLANADHETKHECSLLLVSPAGLVAPTGQQGRIAAIESNQNKDSHAKHVRHIPSGQNRIVEDQDATDNEAHGPSSSKLVSDVASANHDDKVDSTNTGGNVVDLGHRVVLGPTEIQTKVLHYVGAASQGPARVGNSEGVHLPGAEDATNDTPIHLADGLAAFLFDTFASSLPLPFVEVECGRCVRRIREGEQPVDDDRDSQDKVEDEKPSIGWQPTLAFHACVQRSLEIAGEHLADDTGDHKQATAPGKFTLPVPAADGIHDTRPSGTLEKADEEAQSVELGGIM